jgi:hypothetical protein
MLQPEVMMHTLLELLSKDISFRANHKQNRIIIHAFEESRSLPVNNDNLVINANDMFLSSMDPVAEYLSNYIDDNNWYFPLGILLQTGHLILGKESRSWSLLADLEETPPEQRWSRMLAYSKRRAFEKIQDALDMFPMEVCDIINRLHVETYMLDQTTDTGLAVAVVNPTSDPGVRKLETFHIREDGESIVRTLSYVNYRLASSYVGYPVYVTLTMAKLSCTFLESGSIFPFSDDLEAIHYWPMLSLIGLEDNDIPTGFTSVPSVFFADMHC